MLSKRKQRGLCQGGPAPTSFTPSLPLPGTHCSTTPGMPVEGCCTAGRLSPTSGFKVVPLGGVAFKAVGLSPPAVTPGCLCQRQFGAI